jgi:alpha-beta hydrolase superfamily lysophospholipase
MFSRPSRNSPSATPDLASCGRGGSRGVGSGCAIALLTLFGASPLAAGRAVIFQAPDGVPLAGMLYEASPRPAPAVVLVHMLGRSKDEWIPIAERLQDQGVSALAIDLRGHGHSAGNGAELPTMVGDVQAAVAWLSTRPGVRAASLGVVGASLGANLAGLAAANESPIRALALVSPSLDYRGLRLDSAMLRKRAGRSVWLAASTEDPYALRTVRELAGDDALFEQRLSSVRAHGTPLLAADPDLARALVDWLKARLIS